MPHSAGLYRRRFRRRRRARGSAGDDKSCHVNPPLRKGAKKSLFRSAAARHLFTFSLPAAPAPRAATRCTRARRFSNFQTHSLARAGREARTHTYTPRTRERGRERVHAARKRMSEPPTSQPSNRLTNRPANGAARIHIPTAHTRRLGNGFLTGRNVNRHSAREERRQLLDPVAPWSRRRVARH